jgi:hypothetical protein
MEILSYGSVKGDGAVNEDIAGTAGPLAWIFDGATATGPQIIPAVGSDAEWLAHRLDSTMHELASDEDTAGLPLRELAGRLIADVRHGLSEYDLPPDSLTPYAPGALLRSRPGRVEYLLLGDVTIAFHCGDRTEVIVDERATRMAAAATDLAHNHHGDDLRRRQQEFERTYVNQPAGYWVFGSEPAAATNAILGHFDIHQPGLALLATDGFARIVELFHLAPSWRDLIDTLASDKDSVTSMIDMLRTAEAGQNNGDRIKNSDDATALLLRISA